MIHGVINVYKEKGYTSHDVVAKLRGIVGQKKIGHTGTLDPDAEGVLPVCFGRATRLCDMLTDKDKVYETVMLLGIETDTQDISGSVVKELPTEHLTEETVLKAIKRFEGSYAQVPPMYSALKVNGQKLYELAREGKIVERKARQVEIFSVEVLEMNLPRVRMRVHCSKGTYIRTLCHDIGHALACGACMETLLRTRVERFTIDDAKKLGEIESLKKEGHLSEILLPIDQMFSNYRKVTVLPRGEKLAYNGNSVYKRNVAEGAASDGEEVRLYDKKGSFIGIYRYSEKKQEYMIVKMFYLEERD